MSKKIFLRGGFSLVELLVIVSIILILTGIGSYTISHFTQASKISTLRNYISTEIKLARNLAMTNQLPNGDLDLSYVRVLLSNTSLVVSGIDEDGIGTTESPYFSVELEKADTTSITDISFGFLGTTGRLTDESGNLSAGPVVITLTDGSQEYSLTVNDLGIINNSD